MANLSIQDDMVATLGDARKIRMVGKVAGGPISMGGCEDMLPPRQERQDALKDGCCGFKRVRYGRSGIPGKQQTV